MAVSIDVAGRATIAPAFDLAKAAFGPVTILANNAGMAVRDHALDTSANDWHQIMDVNLDGVFFVAQKVARRMVAAGVGKYGVDPKHPSATYRRSSTRNAESE